MQVRSLGQEDLLRRARQPNAVFLPGESNGQRSLAGYSPWGHTESDTTERLHFLFFYHAGEVKTYAGDIRDAGSIPGSRRSPEANGNPLQYSYLENPMDRGAWQATVHGIAKELNTT